MMSYKSVLTRQLTVASWRSVREGTVIFGDPAIGRACNCNHTNMDSYQKVTGTLVFLGVNVLLNLLKTRKL
jgi:hypothetical protein